jgi:hypothetical protein
MPKAELHQVMFAIRKINEGWYVELPDDTRIGPYLPNIAVEVAATNVLLARKRGLDAHNFVRDEHGNVHSCAIVDRTSDPNRCQECERSWSTSGLSVRCPLRSALVSSSPSSPS